MEAFGREFLEKIARQEINVQNISGAALAELVASGEVPLSPTIFNSNIAVAKQKGAPVEWRPIDPVVATTGTSGMVIKAPNPHAALFFLDFLHSKDGQEAVLKGGLSSARNDIGSPDAKVQKSLHREQVFSGRNGEEIRRVGRLEAPPVHQQALMVS